jgi:hypothetical protein
MASRGYSLGQTKIQILIKFEFQGRDSTGKLTQRSRASSAA